MLRKVPQEGLEGEPVNRISEAFENKYTGAYKHNFCGKEQQVMWNCIQQFHRLYSSVWYRQKLQTKVSSYVSGVKETKSVTMNIFRKKIFSFYIICKGRINLRFYNKMLSTAENCMEKWIIL